MFPYKTSIKLNRDSSQALYLQLSNQIIQLIKSRTLAPKTKLPGSRTLAKQLQVHRKTIVACYEELQLQGWIESIAQKGTFVHRDLPKLQSASSSLRDDFSSSKVSGFAFYKTSNIPAKSKEKGDNIIYINDGISDPRLTPIDDLSRTYRNVTAKKNVIKHLSYGSTLGNHTLRKVLVKYLNESRGLHINDQNIMLTRGSQMGIWLSSKLLLKKGDIIAVGKTNYQSADLTFLSQKAIIKRVTVDQDGLVTSEIEKLCQKQKIKAIYVTSHHHHPTTVTLSAERRLHLLNLSKKYQFAIIEDDYDYDFNFNHAPILPLASHDTNGNVIYIGSVCKTVAPVYRIGYLIASEEFVTEAAKTRGLIDRQGDALLELTFAHFIKSGDLDRHIRKVLKIYKRRRDIFCQLLKEKLRDYLDFEIPLGGMAVWVQLKKQYSWEKISTEAKKYKLDIGNWKRYDNANLKHNSIRIGFASQNERETIELVEKLKCSIEASIA